MRSRSGRRSQRTWFGLPGCKEAKLYPRGRSIATLFRGRTRLASYVSAFVSVFRHPVRTGRPGRPRLEEESGLLIGPVVKHRSQRHVVGVTRRVVRGTAGAIAAVLLATGTGTMINTAYLERLNATFRAASTPMTRRGRAIARTET